MTEALLRARLTTLRRNLTVTQSVSSKDRTELVLKESIQDDAWQTAFGQLAYQAQQLTFEIDDLETDLEQGEAIQAAWTRYRSIRDRTQRTCSDCLELVGGFALREKLLEHSDDRLLDRRVTAVTEAIAQICRTAYLDLRGMFAVPAPDTALSRTMARIVRARFPEWTVWTLPAAAYEYAHVVLSEIGPINEAIKAERRLRLREEGLTERSQRGRRRSDQLQAQLLTLYADAFATRVMGPAYACAMIVLRLDPLREETDVAPSDRDRAATIAEVLRRAYPASAKAVDPDTEAPWRFVRDEVLPWWDDMCDEAGPTAASRRSEQEGPTERARAFMDRNWTALRNGILPDALYPYDALGECWVSAGSLAKHWTERLNEVSSGEPETRGFRDVLNAAWICRIKHPDRAQTLTSWSRGACDTILKQQPRTLSTEKPEARQSLQASGAP